MSRETEKEAAAHRNERRRLQILDAATECFRRRGFHAASMAEISKSAGMSVGHIYHYFENKEAIIAALVESKARELADKMDAMRQEQDLLTAMIDKVDEGLAKNSDQALAALKIEVLAEATRNARTLDTLRASDRLALDKMRENVAAVNPALGASPKTVDGRANVVAALFDGIAIRTLLNPDFDREAVLDALRLAIRSLLHAAPTP
ncbi:TetR/AcrR family transcriptional regulator [Solimonas soli]|uniref:TetR/AcrR family transcriptional regulator n=1 Tax=Solimonas soli TaxID=413479 RepID=UPI0004892FA0|nr:TetR/AcrR family transcriptional regulator [Solimonas soli]